MSFAHELDHYLSVRRSFGADVSFPKCVDSVTGGRIFP
jgi:hypothetical protein